MVDAPSQRSVAPDNNPGSPQTYADAPSVSDPIAWLDRALLLRPDKPFIETAQGRRLTYAALAELSLRFAAALGSHDVEPGDRVVVRVDKSPEAIALYLACLRAGAVFVPLNTAYTSREFSYFIGDAEPKLVVVRPEDFVATKSLLAGSYRGRIETLGEDACGTLLASATNVANANGRYGEFAPNVLAALLYTSGTTGQPKAAMLTRGNLASNAATLVDYWRFSDDDVLLHALPIFHAHGLFVATNTILACGASMLFMPKFSADEALRLMPRVTVMMGVPTYYTRLLSHPRLSRDSTRHVRVFISGSAPLAAEHHREFEKRTGHAILERYGMTETLMNTSNPYAGKRVPGSVGPALPGVEVRITEPETGALLTEQDALGMIEVRGPNVFLGYWRNPEKTATELRADGFFITGDVGRVDAEGYVYLLGRSKDLIISGGYNVYPAEVEQEINALPGVQDSAVFGVSHPDFGEGVTAMVVRTPQVEDLDESTVLHALKDRLAAYKLPKRVLFTAELPQNIIGKVQKKALREAYADLYRKP